MTQAELLRALQNASDNIMRLAGQVRASAPEAVEARADELAMARERALAHTIIDRLLALPAAPVRH
jgi:gamma-glutamyl phosphate reductase